MMIKLKPDKECVVCGKCVISCPKGAISYGLGEYGNYFPVIDKEKCIECHVCEQVCGKKIDFDADYLSAHYYIGYYKNEGIREKSSSGGIFSALAMHILQQDGEVIGATYDKETQTVKHIAVTKEEDLDRLRKSKYVQSDWISSYKMIEEAIRKDKWILVSGTPCQIETLQEQFGSYNKVFFVDLFCHGVTMAGIFQDYVCAEGGVAAIDFRHRKPGEDINFTMRIMKGNGNIVEEEWGQNTLCRLFVDSCTLKGACLNCRYAAQKHKSDITIGDFAGWYKFALHCGIDYPLASVISLNSEKGVQLFQTIQDGVECCKLEDTNIIASYYKQHEKIHGPWGYEKELWESFHKIYREKGFSIAAIELLYKKELELCHRIDEIKDPGTDIAIYGAGIIGKRMKWIINMVRASWNIKYFVETKKGTENQIENIPVISLQELTENHDNALVVVAVSNKYTNAIVEELEKTGRRFVV